MWGIKPQTSDMTETLLDLLKKYNLDIGSCRGQSYDNARNMTGYYNGL